MNFLPWAALTALTLTAGLSLALRLGRDFSIGDQLVAGIVTALSIIVGAIQALGYASVLYPWTLGPATVVIDLAVLRFARPEPGAWRVFGSRLASAARRSVLTPVGLLATVPALLLLLFFAAYVVLLPTWGWDALWYHEPIAAYAYQNHSLHWVDTHIPFINSYPKNIELLALWNVIFAPDDRLIEGVQLPLALMTIVAIASMCRRCGASPTVSWALGLSWLFFPAVLLNIPSGYNDAATASLRIVAILFLARADARTAHRVFGSLALGVYLGSKVSGLAHAAILGAVVAVVLAVEIRRNPENRLRLALQPIPMSIAVLGLGGATYFRDLILYGNPVWPAKVNLFGYELPGTWDWGAFDKPPWGGTGGIGAMWRSFHEHARSPLVDIRAGGFGPLWLYALLPFAVAAILIGAWRLRRRESTPGILWIAAFAGTAMATGAPWWPRHVLAMPVSGLIGAAILFSRLRWWIVPHIVAAGVLVASFVQAWPMRLGFTGTPDLMWDALSMTPAQRSELKVGTWTYPGVNLREQAIQPGDAAIYDEKLKFIYQLWRYDWKSQVLFRPMQGEPKDWLARIEGERVKWAFVIRGGIGETTLRNAGWLSYGKCSVENATVWMRPDALKPR